MYRLGSRVYSLLFIGTALASFISLLIANLVLPYFGWPAVYMLFAVICLFSLLLLMVFEEKPDEIKRDNNQEEVEGYYKLMVSSKKGSNNFGKTDKQGISRNE